MGSKKKRKKNNKVVLEDVSLSDDAARSGSEGILNSDVSECGVSDKTESEIVALSDSSGDCDISSGNGGFARSLDEFTSDDTGAGAPHAKKGPDIVRLVTIGILGVVCASSSMTLVRNIYDKYRGEQIYNQIASGVEGSFVIGSSDTVSDGVVTMLASDAQSPYTPSMADIIRNGINEDANRSDKSYAAELERMRASLTSLKSINSEIYAWISVPGTSINYPVAQSSDNVYYLDHAYTGDNLVNGSIFADYRCSSYIPDNYNTIFYGHNITSGSMFHAVEDFFRQDVFENTKIYVYTFDGVFVFKPFSIHETSYDSGFISMEFPSEDILVSFLENLQNKSEIPSDAKFSADSRILTLSTCTNGISTKRYALHAVLVESITD